MRRVIFYSWQSDLPNATNRGFIQQALENAAAAITSDDTVAVEPVVDRDTQGVAGSPDIAVTIFEKIAKADIVVADVSFILNPRKGRATPNPNVLIELGYALRALGHERIILVFNRAFGKIEQLPFDLRMRRSVSYYMPETVTERAPERTKLEGVLNAAIRTALEHIPQEAVVDKQPIALSAIENNQANRVILLRRNLRDILRKLDELQPRKHSEGGTVDDLIDGINKTEETVFEFSRIAETIAVMNDREAALEVYKWFGPIFERYNLPRSFSGNFSRADFDFFKFVGHELFVTFIALLLREQRWDPLANVLDEAIPMQYVPDHRSPGSVDWSYASEHIALLIDESRKKQRISVHSDMLSTRHAKGRLSEILAFEDFIAGDFLLYLRGEVAPSEASDGFITWRPWSALYLKATPMFLLNAQKFRVAEQVGKVLGVPDVAELKKRIRERGPRLARLFKDGWWDYPVSNTDIEKLGEVR